MFARLLGRTCESLSDKMFQGQMAQESAYKARSRQRSSGDGNEEHACVKMHEERVVINWKKMDWCMAKNKELPRLLKVGPSQTLETELITSQQATVRLTKGGHVEVRV